jgi:phage shock protein PspC (stress-responsive transcriptional regulator)
MDSEPEEKHTESKKDSTAYRRLFRDPDRRIIAGVCSGVAAYLKTDPLIIRILFLVAFLASGVGLLVYIILWIALPEAITTAEKLQMHGKPVNIETIEKTIKAEVKEVKRKLDKYATEARDSYEKQKYNVRRTSNQVVDILARIMLVFGRILGIIIGLVLLFTGIALVISFGALFFGWDSFSFVDGGHMIHVSISEFFNYILSSQMAISLTPVALTLFIGIPLVMLIYASLRLIIGKHFRIPNFGNSMGMLWVVSLIGIIFIVIDTLTDFKHKSTYEISNEVITLGDDEVLYLRAENFLVNDKTPTVYMFGNQYIIESTDQGNVIHAYPRLNISRTTDGFVSLKINQLASGYTLDDAELRAGSIYYGLSITDSLVTMPPLYSFSAIDKIRSQEVLISIKVPEGQVIYFDESMKKLMLNNPHRYWSGLSFAGTYWEMTDKGLTAYTKE